MANAPAARLLAARTQAVGTSWVGHVDLLLRAAQVSPVWAMKAATLASLVEAYWSLQERYQAQGLKAHAAGMRVVLAALAAEPTVWPQLKSGVRSRIDCVRAGQDKARVVSTGEGDAIDPGTDETEELRPEEEVP